MNISKQTSISGVSYFFQFKTFYTMDFFIFNLNYFYPHANSLTCNHSSTVLEWRTLLAHDVWRLIWARRSVAIVIHSEGTQTRNLIKLSKDDTGKAHKRHSV